MPIPKVMHLIWVGEKGFPNQESLKAWQTANPDIQLIIWVDKQSTPPKVFEDYKNGEKYQDTNGNPYKEVEITKGTPIDQQLNIQEGGNPIMFADIRTAGMMSEEAHYEITRNTPNYGAASDLIRYEILAHFGGIYIDDDNKPRNPFSRVYNFIKGCLKKDEEKIKESQHFLHVSPKGNDLYICTSAGNPAMARLRDKAKSRYHKAVIAKDRILQQLTSPDNYDSDPATIL